MPDPRSNNEEQYQALVENRYIPNTTDTGVKDDSETLRTLNKGCNLCANCTNRNCRMAKNE